MTSKERKEERYQRRKFRREFSRKIRSYEHTSFNDIFGLNALLESFKKCSRTNKWKTSVKKYGSKILINCSTASKKLSNNIYKPKKCRNFTLCERGHVRFVQSLHISDMMIQGSLRDNCLYPIIKSYLIYDNGACLSNKGTTFALKRFVRHLKYHTQKYGLNGYIYFFDFKSYFENIDRTILYKMINEIVFDKTMISYLKLFSSQLGETGLGLGSSISQICAIFYPNKIDHFLKDKLGIKCYGRYMDDGYIIHNDLEKLKNIIKMFENKCREYGIKLNKNKCQIVKLTSNFKFLKVRFFLTDKCKIIRRPNKKSNVIERRRLKKFKSLIKEGTITFKDALLYFHSWICSRKLSRCYNSNFSMIKYFNSMFSGIGYYKPPKTKTRNQKVLFCLSKKAIFSTL